MEKEMFYMRLLYILNNGYHTSLLLLLPFIAKDIHINIAQVGFLSGMLNIVGIIFAIPATYLAAKVGGIKILIYGVFIYGLSYFLTSFTDSFAYLVLLFFSFGIAFSIFQPVAFALLSRWAAKGEKGRVLGNFTALSDFGRVGFSVITTPLVGLIGWIMTARVLAILPIAVFFYLYFFYLPQVRVNHASDKESKDTTLYIDILKNGKLMLATLTSTFDSLASTAIFVFLPFLFIARHINPSLIGTMAGGFFIGTYLGKRFIGKLADKFGDAKVFVVIEILMALCLILLSINQQIIFTIVLTVVLGIVTKGTAPSSLSMVSKTLEAYEHHEKAFGVNTIIVSIGTTLAPIILGFASYHFGIEWAFLTAAAFAILAIIPPIILQEIYKTEAKLVMVETT